MPAYEPNATVTGFDLQKAKDALAASGCKAPCSIDFSYPDSVSRPYMVDPKGEFEAIRTMLEAAGFKVNPQHKPWKGGYLNDEANGKYGLAFIGWIYDYADPADGPGIFYSTSAGQVRQPDPDHASQLRGGRGQPSLAAGMAKAIAEPDTAKRHRTGKT